MFSNLFAKQTQKPKTTVPERKDTEETQNQVSSNVKDGQTPELIEAIKKNNQQEFSRLLNLKTDPSGKKFIDEIDTERKGSPLYWAADCGYVHFIAPLIKAGAAVNKPNKNGSTPLFAAAWNGHAEAIRVLKSFGANMNTVRPDGWTPVYVAAANGHASTIAALHAAGANVNTPRNDGATPVYIAAEKGHAEAIAALHALGANVNTPTKEDGFTPVFIAAQQGHASTIAALHAAGANVNTPRKDGDMPLCVAARNGHAATITALLETGADASVKTPWGTALEQAKQAKQGKEPGHPEIVRLLEAHLKQYPNGIKPVLKTILNPVPAKVVDKEKAATKPPAQKLTSPSVPASRSPGYVSGHELKTTYEVKTTHDSPTEPTKPTQAPLTPTTPTLKDASPSNANPFISYQINYTELNFGKELGKGGFGIVYQGTWRKHTEVAIKQLLSDDVSPEAKAEFETESQVMARLRSPNIVQFYGYCLSPRHCLVMEYMPNGSLFSVLKTKQPLDWSIRARIAIDMACGLAFLHQEHIVHRDIKSLNVLLDKSYGAKLTDFGLSRVKTETKSQSMASKTSKDAFGTLAWMAPELFERRATYTQKSDIYSLGITLWELASRKIPFADAGTPALIPSWVSKGDREDIPQDCPQKLASLITACWEGSPDKRPDADTVVDYLKSEQTNFAQFLPLLAAHRSEYQSNVPSPAARGYCLETGYQNNPQARPVSTGNGFCLETGCQNNLPLSAAVPKPTVLEDKKPPT